ncbi:MAG: glutathione S-transferase C-terminal domain-containing protein, partial [Myxococcota bacterium]
VSYACPWAHRCLIVRSLRGLQDIVPVSVVHWFMGEDGWSFDEGPGVVADPGGARFLRDVYLRAKKDFTGRVTVPILWDTETGAIVNNESREIVRMFDDVFPGRADVNFHPADLHDAIEETIDAIYEPINNGVYRSGFARSQRAYEEAVHELFGALDHWEGVLSKQRYLCGDRLTEADFFLFTTLVRFDPVYHYHFKCNLKRLRDYPNLWGFTREIYQLPGVAETVRMDHIKEHYFGSHESVNPARVVPAGPIVDFDEPHGRDRLQGAPLSIAS